MANCYVFLGNTAEALEMVQKAEQLNPSGAERLFEIGRIYHSLLRHQQALEYYLKVEDLGYEDKGNLHSAIASCYLGLADSEKALKFASKAVEFDPENDYAQEVLESAKDSAQNE